MSVSYIVLGDDGSHRVLTTDAPPSEHLVLGVERQAATQRRGVYIAKMTVVDRKKTLTHHKTIGNPASPFDLAAAKFDDKNNGGARHNFSNQGMFNN